MNQLAVSFYVVPVMGMTMTGCGLFVFFVWLRRLLRLPLGELALALLAFVKGLDVGQEAPGYGLDLILRDARIVDKLFPSAQHGPPDSDGGCVERLV